MLGFSVRFYSRVSCSGRPCCLLLVEFSLGSCHLIFFRRKVFAVPLTSFLLLLCSLGIFWFVLLSFGTSYRFGPPARISCTSLVFEPLFLLCRFRLSVASNLFRFRSRQLDNYHCHPRSFGCSFVFFQSFFIYLSYIRVLLPRSTFAIY